MYAQDKDDDDRGIERVTNEMYEKVIAGRGIPQPQSKHVHAEITELDNNYTFKEAVATRSNCEGLKDRFVNRYDEKSFAEYMKLWMNGVNGFFEGQRIFEHSALTDFFEALELGTERVIERAIQIGLSK